ncbi:hypothetical protein [Bartonella harrusi]|uniref:Stability/partitioning determinant n=1 Tax=Bartonella harrusi TaxID=2961895 RepID=A0ABY5EQY8_9HYPH|nr:hypothetical protein [Bartonella harrusi]UTO27667.1 hypothetical protein NMK50_00170 [Bartonella harrusi]
MTKERKPTFTILDNLSTVEPTTKAPKRDKQDIDKIAQQSGFTTRHASFEDLKEPILTKSGHVDGRSKRRSMRTNRITLAIRPDVDEEFRALAEKLTPPGQNLLTLGDVLQILIRSYNNSVKG